MQDVFIALDWMENEFGGCLDAGRHLPHRTYGGRSWRAIACGVGIGRHEVWRDLWEVAAACKAWQVEAGNQTSPLVQISAPFGWYGSGGIWMV